WPTHRSIDTPRHRLTESAAKPTAPSRSPSANVSGTSCGPDSLLHRLSRLTRRQHGETGTSRTEVRD
ncbi:MAG: hypothetical protein AVDCRST_MAG43-267, partial [uncultured Thermomicrobiales bacterium]